MKYVNAPAIHEYKPPGLLSLFDSFELSASVISWGVYDEWAKVVVPMFKKISLI